MALAIAALVLLRVVSAASFVGGIGHCDSMAFAVGSSDSTAYKKVAARDAGACCVKCVAHSQCGHWLFDMEGYASDACHLKKGPLAPSIDDKYKKVDAIAKYQNKDNKKSSLLAKGNKMTSATATAATTTRTRTRRSRTTTTAPPTAATTRTRTRRSRTTTTAPPTAATTRTRRSRTTTTNAPPTAAATRIFTRRSRTTTTSITDTATSIEAWSIRAKAIQKWKDNLAKMHKAKENENGDNWGAVAKENKKKGAKANNRWGTNRTIAKDIMKKKGAKANQRWGTNRTIAKENKNKGAKANKRWGIISKENKKKDGAKENTKRENWGAVAKYNKDGARVPWNSGAVAENKDGTKEHAKENKDGTMENEKKGGNAKGNTKKDAFDAWAR